MNCPIKRWTRRKEARPEEILLAALALFVEKGYAATKIEDIARAAGVTRGTPYLYFANKEEIFKAVIRELLLPKLPLAGEMVDLWQGSARDLLRQVFFTWWEVMGATQLSALPKLMIAEAGNFPDVLKLYHDEFIVPGDALIRRVLELGVRRGEFVIKDIDYALHILSAPIVMAMLWQHSVCRCAPEPIEPGRYLDTTLDILLNGLLLRDN
ncbi:TetR/AcrR family transcriptional regulator [Chitinibacter sp. GC72]|uniref:TetR/AcrR family transcriptional regulator n=1 Tax=Chitinibacter sp. GC72 TaxID=1526917 RepID=UPI0012F8E094|nr:TetR/AcrR family transcriptional regulator [Chitinibacter sp. GC72]